MKKKIFALMMALVMALPLAACGDEPGTPDNNTAAARCPARLLMSCTTTTP